MATVATLRIRQNSESTELFVGPCVGNVKLYVEQTLDGTIHIFVKDESTGS